MNIVVCIKQVPETNRVEVDPQTGVLKRGGVASKMNPYDLYALETALGLRERFGGGVSALSMGPPQAEQVLREALAMGADAGYLLSDRRFGGADVLATSYTLSQGVRKIGPVDLILCGKQTTDGDTAQVGPEMAEYLDIPSASNVVRIDEVTPEGISVAMELSEALQLLRMPFPCLLSVEKGICQPRLPSYLRKKAMQDTPITVWSLADMEDRDENHYGLTGSPTQVQRIFPPDSREQRELWEDPGEILAERLLSMLHAQKLLP